MLIEQWENDAKCLLLGGQGGWELESHSLGSNSHCGSDHALGDSVLSTEPASQDAFVEPNRLSSRASDPRWESWEGHCLLMHSWSLTNSPDFTLSGVSVLTEHHSSALFLYFSLFWHTVCGPSGVFLELWIGTNVYYLWTDGSTFLQTQMCYSVVKLLCCIS